MTKATWKGTVIAESDDVIVVDGYTYFPVSAVKSELLRPSTKRTVCSWKGDASYFDVVVGSAVNSDAAWQYQDPKPAADMVRGRIGFWRGVVVER